MDRIDAFLERKARAAFPFASVYESDAGEFWLTRVPTGKPELLAANVATPDHPRRAFLKARVRLAVLVREAKVSS